MKKIKLYLSTVLTVGLLLFTACEKEAIDPLTGKYPVPENYTLAALVSQDMVKGATTRTFTLELGNAEQRLSVEFTGNRLNYFLAPNAYTIAKRAEAKAGNYVAGDAEGGTYWVASGSKLKLTDGTIFVALNGDTYTISGTVMLENESIIKFAYTGVIEFEADPPSFTYTLEVTKPYSWTTDGMTFNDVAGSQLNKISVSSEGTPVGYLEIVTEEDPASFSGTYPVKVVNTLEHAVVQGQFMNLLWLGIADIPIESGSYYLDGETKMFIREGNITIVDNSGVLTITGSGLGIQDISTQMSFGNLPTSGSVNYQEAMREVAPISMPNLLSASATDLAAVTGGAETGYTVTLKFGEASVTATPNTFGGVDISGTGKFVSIDFKRDAGTLLPGTYNIMAGTEAAVGDAIAGYVLDLGFVQINSGSIWATATGGAPEEAFILAGGTVTVVESGGTYTITVNATIGEGEPVKAVYTGPIAIP
jgi:hypothetical protein